MLLFYIKSEIDFVGASDGVTRRYKSFVGADDATTRP
jgi:hypothetical protein